MRFVLFLAFLLAPVVTLAQTSTDLFVMPSSDFVRSGLEPRANLNIGIGHTFSALTPYKIGDEPTFGYTYENGGSHGFWHTQYGSHTMALGLMKNFSMPKGFGAYLWAQGGLTSMTGFSKVKNRGYNGDSVGLTIQVHPHQSVWIQETYNKVASVPWYTSTGVGYTVSW